MGAWKAPSLNLHPRDWQSKALVYDNARMQVDVVDISEIDSHPDEFTKTAAAGKGDRVDIYLNVTIGKNEPIKCLYTTADLSKLDLSTRMQRWRGKFDHIYIRGRCPEDAEARTSGWGCLE